jgi:predicted DCC family thiol-disulfide oxidoreductase YuxK
LYFQLGLKIMKKTASSPGWVFYDGECRFCVAAARRFRPVWSRLGFDDATLQDPWVVRRIGLPYDVLMSQMWMLTPDGIILGGIDAWLYLARRVWWGFPLRIVAAMPGGKWLLNRSYLWLAARRYCIAGACENKGMIGRRKK